MKEWRKIKDFDRYSVSNDGEVRNDITGRIMRGNHNYDGYKQVHLTNDETNKYQRVHRLVAEAFIPNPEGKPQVNHIDGVKTNNHVSNLEWCTDYENSWHKWNVLGYKVSDESRKKMSIAQKKRSAEISRTVSEYRTGKYLLGENPNAKKVIRIEDGKVFNSMKEAGADSKTKPHNISACCNRRQHTAGGYHWKFV